MDLLSPVRVVVVDDNPAHLISIANGLAAVGIPCVSHWYDIQSGSLIPSVPSGGYPHLRMLFTDLNIQEMTGANADPKSLAGVLISEVLCPVISPSSGPYAICLWTSTGKIAEEVCPVITDRLDHESMDDNRRPSPLLVNVLDKQPFLKDLSASADEPLKSLFQNCEKVESEISKSIAQVIGQDAQLKAAISWESRASYAAAQTINNVYRVSNFEKTDDVRESAAFSTVLAKIAIEAAGKKNAKDNAPRALDDGLIDLFFDQMRSTVSEIGYHDSVLAAIGGILGPSLSVSSRSRLELNTILHIERQAIDGSLIERGLVFDINDQSTLDSLGLGNRNKILWNELLFSTKDFEMALEKATAEKSPMINRISDEFDFVKKNKDRVAAESRIVMIELGADCDHAQRKERTLRFLLGVEVPSALSLFVSGPQNDCRELRNAALLRLGPWAVTDGSEVDVLVSVNRFAAQQDWSRKAGINARYRLRKALVDLLLHRYSMHSTRPGIISIN